MWWLAWKPAKQPPSADAIPHGRRIYRRTRPEADHRPGLRTDDGGGASPEPVASPASEESAGQVAKALDGVTARHVLGVPGPGARVDVIPVDTKGH
ncbi:hypothetical protein QFZ30_000285 [Arthrobacter pascens]|uniref:hypothetical protein n=1 Tax=Arthrobacter pascens TaxID=1677 RepID=UPI00278D38A3|nr:hypothetical protein [Arthrobacter pascens]MDQ0676903.1 hypothetical protein [Arthrobacter pascens]